MPLFKTAQRNSLSKPALDDYYLFPDKHKSGWMKFFEAMDADEEKIIAWAEKSDIEHPKAWYESLHKFLFDMYSGTPAMLKKAAKETFSAFLEEVASNHEKNPKLDYWYHNQQIKRQRFIEVLKEAAQFEDIAETIRYINARMMNLGFYLYSEYILSKTKFYSDTQKIASELNKQAYDLECLVLGKSPVEIKEGDLFNHAFSESEKYRVEQIVWDTPDKVSPSAIVAKDMRELPVLIIDLWNIQPQN
jgi:hypothetical protein